jgi:hypothetical protein
MSLQSDIQPYINKDGFVGGSPCAGLGRVCDNHFLFTVEYLIQLLQQKEIILITPGTPPSGILSKCVKQGVLTRYPDDTSVDDSMDNWIAYAAVATPAEARKTLWHLITHFGFANVSGKFTKNAFIARFPTLMSALYQATNLPALPPILTAVAIATSNRNEPLQNTSDRKLTYLLIHAMRRSLLCRLAARIWYSRLRKLYGDEGMRVVYSIYFGPQHPLSKYAVNPWEVK